jgi:integrase
MTTPSFEDARAYALIWMLCEGPRRTEIVQMRLDDLSADLVLQSLVRVVPLMGAHAQHAGRLVPLSPATARAIASYLRVRRYHRHAACPQLWLGLLNHGPINGWGCTGCSRAAPSRPGMPRTFTRTCRPPTAARSGFSSENDAMIGLTSHGSVIITR